MPSQARASTADDAPRITMPRTLRLLVRDSNINNETLLATDYLNHFNEIVMLLELAGQMPELMDDVRAWKPKCYAQHFRDANISESALAIMAYENAPLVYRQPFDAVVEQLDTLITGTIEELDWAVADGDGVRAAELATGAVAEAHALIAGAAAIINGHAGANAQEQIDALFAD